MGRFGQLLGAVSSSSRSIEVGGGHYVAGRHTSLAAHLFERECIGADRIEEGRAVLGTAVEEGLIHQPGVEYDASHRVDDHLLGASLRREPQGSPLAHLYPARANNV